MKFIILEDSITLSVSVVEWVYHADGIVNTGVDANWKC